jgi:Domain of unknown function (DUF4833)
VPLSSWLPALLAVGLAAPIARGGGSEREAHVVRSVFFVAKSENKNQVHYGILLDAACAPAGDAPVFAYWRMLEHGPLSTEPLLAREIPAYGIARQQILKRGESHETGGQVMVTLNALPKRAIFIDSVATGATCAATARTSIEGISATLISVFVQLRWPFGVDHMVLAGRAPSDGRVVLERLEP